MVVESAGQTFGQKPNKLYYFERREVENRVCTQHSMSGAAGGRVELIPVRNVTAKSEGGREK